MSSSRSSDLLVIFQFRGISSELLYESRLSRPRSSLHLYVSAFSDGIMKSAYGYFELCIAVSSAFLGLNGKNVQCRFIVGRDVNIVGNSKTRECHQILIFSKQRPHELLER